MGRTSGNYGFSSVNRSLNPQLSNTSLSNKNEGSSIFSARVISIVLDESHPRFNELGGWNALGAIEYDPTDSPNYNLNNYPIAYPINTNNKNLPLKNEIVTLISSFSSAVDLFEEGIPIIAGESKKYYINIINLWNHPHHNGYSFKINNTPPSQNKNYDQTQVGSYNTPSDNAIKLNLGKTFKEKANIHPLLPFEGDVIYEGRWGNSIRLGSTITGSYNDWSNIGESGDPITIIRNGQGNQTEEGWIPIIENINNIESSIYLTSTQNIPLTVASSDYTSYSGSIYSSPENPSKYKGNQIILNSGRLVFNTTSDHILLSSVKSINLNSQECINIDTKKVLIQSNQIYLGIDPLANEPLLLGNTTVDLLKNLVSSLLDLTNTLKTLTSDPVSPNSPATFTELNIKSIGISTVLQSILKELGTTPEDCKLTSKRNFTL